MRDIMILAQSVRQFCFFFLFFVFCFLLLLFFFVFVFFVHKVPLLYKMPKSEKGDNSVNIYRILPKVKQVIYTLDTICEPNIMILDQVVLQIFCSQC